METLNSNPVHQPPRRKHIDWVTRTVRIELFILLVGIALLLASVSIYLGLSGTASEFDRVDTKKYQAVFLNGAESGTSGNKDGSLYFGHIVKMNDKYVVLRDVYFLTPSSSDQNQNSPFQLTKLGCQQLHSPYDEMVINRDTVAFWENLKNDGKVVTAIKEYIKQNPNGPNCTTSTQSSSQGGSSTQTPSSSTPNNSSNP